MPFSFLYALHAALPATIVFIGGNSLIEYIILKVTGIAPVHYFEQMLSINFGMKFHLLNLSIILCEMYLVMLFHSCIRTFFISRLKLVLITSLFFLLFLSLFLAQIIITGIYPVKVAIVLLIAAAGALPLSVMTGAFILEKQTGTSSPQRKTDP